VGGAADVRLRVVVARCWQIATVSTGSALPVQFACSCRILDITEGENSFADYPVRTENGELV
jgi:hypothetical protein